MRRQPINTDLGLNSQLSAGTVVAGGQMTGPVTVEDKGAKLLRELSVAKEGMSAILGFAKQKQETQFKEQLQSKELAIEEQKRQNSLIIKERSLMTEKMQSLNNIYTIEKRKEADKEEYKQEMRISANNEYVSMMLNGEEPKQAYSTMPQGELKTFLGQHILQQEIIAMSNQAKGEINALLQQGKYADADETRNNLISKFNSLANELGIKEFSDETNGTLSTVIKGLDEISIESSASIKSLHAKNAFDKETQLTITNEAEGYDVIDNDVDRFTNVSKTFKTFMTRNNGSLDMSANDLAQFVMETNNPIATIDLILTNKEKNELFDTPAVREALTKARASLSIGKSSTDAGLTNLYTSAKKNDNSTPESLTAQLYTYLGDNPTPEQQKQAQKIINDFKAFKQAEGIIYAGNTIQAMEALSNPNYVGSKEANDYNTKSIANHVSKMNPFTNNPDTGVTEVTKILSMMDTSKNPQILNDIKIDDKLNTSDQEQMANAMDLIRTVNSFSNSTGRENFFKNNPVLSDIREIMSYNTMNNTPEKIMQGLEKRKQVKGAKLEGPETKLWNNIGKVVGKTSYETADGTDFDYNNLPMWMKQGIETGIKNGINSGEITDETSGTKYVENYVKRYEHTDYGFLPQAVGFTAKTIDELDNTETLPAILVATEKSYMKDKDGNYMKDEQGNYVVDPKFDYKSALENTESLIGFQEYDRYYIEDKGNGYTLYGVNDDSGSTNAINNLPITNLDNTINFYNDMISSQSSRREDSYAYYETQERMEDLAAKGKYNSAEMEMKKMQRLQEKHKDGIFSKKQLGIKPKVRSAMDEDPNLIIGGA